MIGLEEFAWNSELQSIIDSWKAGEDYPMDGDEVERLINMLRLKLNVMEGNITWNEYTTGTWEEYVND